MGDSVSLVALFVSLVALFTTLGQLLQQYFATADGYRRCTPSVMGDWAQRTRLRWRWREFRFETIFYIPRIIYGPLHGDVGKRSEELATGQCSLVDTKDSLDLSMTRGGWGSQDARRYYNSDELACWVPLLAQLHKQGKEIIDHFPPSDAGRQLTVDNDTTVPVIQFIRKSWDFMPVDVVRPMASTTVSDVAIMARRLGQVWKKFDPGAGQMRAEGNGHVITSTLARSLGTILQYTYTTRDNPQNCFYIPVKEADKLGFGLVEFDHRLFGAEMGRDLDVGSFDGISSTLSLIIGSRGYHDVVDTVLRNLSQYLPPRTGTALGQFIPGFNDLVPLCSAMLTQDNSHTSPKTRWLTRIPAPNLYLKGVTSAAEGFQVFERRLHLLIEARQRESRHVNYIYDCLKELAARFGSQWYFEKEWNEWQAPRGNQAAPDSHYNHPRNRFIVFHAQMTDYLATSRIRYVDLVADHITLATRPLQSIPSSDAYPIESNYGQEGFNPKLVMSMEAYFDFLPELVVLMNKRNQSLSFEEVEDAWLSMIFRAFCWQRCHVMIEGVAPLPSEYWGSKMPVYIG
jgi:hypothetical protein